MAREAYWNNGLEEASQIYTQLIELEPTVIEYRGELGSIKTNTGEVVSETIPKLAKIAEGLYAMPAQQ